MSDPIIEIDEFTASVIVPEDGDPQDAASVIQGFQPLANRTLRLKNTNRNTAATFTELFAPPLVYIGDPTLSWDPTETGGTPGNIVGLNHDVSDGRQYLIPLPVPQPPANTVRKLVSATIYFVPNTTHVDEPDTQPELTLLRQPLDGSSGMTSIATASTAAADAAAYNALRSLQVSAPAGGHTLVDTEVYWLRFLGEAGGDSLDDMVITGIKVVWSA